MFNRESNIKIKQTVACGVLAVILALTFFACDDDEGGTGTAPTITTASLPGGTVGTAYSQTLATEGDAPITWDIDTGSLPGGLNLSTAGVISGTPTTANTFNFTVKAANAAGNDTKQFSITIAPAPAPTITITSLPGGTVGQAYRQTLAATGDRPITWSIDKGTLPGGLTLSTAGVISGTPTRADIFNFTVKAANAAGNDTKVLSIGIIDLFGPRTWTAVTNSTFGTSEILGIAYGNNRFVAGGYDGKMAYSDDNGVTWTAVTDSTFTSSIYAIAYGNNRFVAGDYDGKMAYSDDGANWTAVDDSKFFRRYIYGIAYGNNRFVAGDAWGVMYSDDNGESWTAGTFASSSGINAIAYGNNRFVAVGGGGRMAYSDDGVSWTAVEDSKFPSTDIYGDSFLISAIAYGNNRFVAVGGGGRMAYSDDGVNWTAVDDSTLPFDIWGITYGNNRFVAGGNYGTMAYSEDGASWKAVTDSTVWRNGDYTVSICAIAYGNDRFVAVGSGGRMAYADW
jgi:hypothetical protein